MERPGLGLRTPLTEALTTMLPAPRESMAGIWWRRHRNTERTLASKTASKVSPVCSSIGLRFSWWPALLNATSIRPKRSSAVRDVGADEQAFGPRHPTRRSGRPCPHRCAGRRRSPPPLLPPPSAGRSPALCSCRRSPGRFCPPSFFERRAAPRFWALRSSLHLRFPAIRLYDTTISRKGKPP